MEGGLDVANVLDRTLIDLTPDLVLGLPPPLPPDPSLHSERTFLRLQHHACLAITGDFLLSIDKVTRL